MKVLFLSHQSAFLYGGEIVTLEFMRELRREGVEVHFAAPQGIYMERAREVANFCHEIPSMQFSRKWKLLPKLMASLLRTRNTLKKILREHGICVLHATSLKAMVFAWSLGNQFSVIWHHHDILPASLPNFLWLRSLSWRSRRILVPSSATRSALLASGISAEKVHVLRNGFRLEEWAARPPRGLNQPFRIGMIGEISPRKGSDRLEGFLKELAGEPDFEVLVVGEGLSDPDFAEKIRERLASNKVKFLGRISPMKDFYREMDLLFVPSRQDPLPTVIVEAGLSAVPVLGARVGGIPEMIENGQNGFLFDNEAEAAEGFRKIRTHWQDFSRQARSFAERNYDIVKITEELKKHYQEVQSGA